MEQTLLLSQIHGEKCWPSVNKTSPCEEACPLGTDVPSYVMAIAQGKLKEALAIIRQTNPLPGVCGRVCHHPCEEKCSRSKLDEPIAVQWLKRLAADYEVMGNGLEKPSPAERTRPEKVAIVGSGPAGLTAAYDLIRQGYSVTIFEASSVIGGMLALGIPDFVLPRQIVEKEVSYIRDLGVEFRTGISIGKDFTLEHLFERGYRAILLATGAHASQGLGIPGENSAEVFDALSLLREAKLGRRVKLGGRVGVIGGGNVAIDASRTALRLGAKEVSIIYRRSREEMPARDDEVTMAEAEGVKIEYLVAPLEILASGAKVAGLLCTRMELGEPDTSGRRRPIPIKGSQFVIELDTVIAAIGQVPRPSPREASGVETTPLGTFKVAPDTLATTLSGVFAAGDCVNLPGTVTDSMAAGRRAAISIDRYLRGQDVKGGHNIGAKEVFEINEKMIPEFLRRKARWEMTLVPEKNRTRGFEEVMRGYLLSEGVEEAKRCLNCRMCGNCIFERDQLCFERGTLLL